MICFRNHSAHPEACQPLLREEIDPQQAMVEAILVEEVDLQGPQQATVEATPVEETDPKDPQEEELVEEVDPQEGVVAAMVVVIYLVEGHQGPLDLKDPNDLNSQWAWIPN